MTVALQELAAALDSLLQPGKFRDYCPNGLQVEGKSTVDTIVSGVTASREFLEAAIEQHADALLVHHGYFWQGEDPRINGIRRQRIKILLEHGLSLFAFHLPLDAHPEFGNNVQLGQKLGFTISDELAPGLDSKPGVCGTLDDPCTGGELAGHIEQKLGRAPLHVPGSAEIINTIAWCTGAAQNFIELAHQRGVDAYLSGEISEQTVHYARESGLHFFSAGHHATERYGVQAVGNYLADKFAIEHRFIDIDNPV